MKNQLCKPCDYRRAFRLRFLSYRQWKRFASVSYRPDVGVTFFKRSPLCTPVEFDICWRYRCPLFPEQVGYFKIAPLLAMLKRAAVKAYGDFYWNNLFANLNGCGPLMANSSKLWESPDK